MIGPFATHDYARGSYGALLALDVLRDYSRFDRNLTFSTALEIKLDENESCEVDYLGWASHQDFGQRYPPTLFIGEAKSFGSGELIKERDLSQLRKIAPKFPGATIVISVLRDNFTENEKKLLLSFIRRTRRLNTELEPTNPVVLLTGIELFGRFSLEHVWKNAGGKYLAFADSHHSRSLKDIAQATQAIHLDLPLFYHDIDERLSRRRGN